MVGGRRPTGGHPNPGLGPGPRTTSAATIAGPSFASSSSSSGAAAVTVPSATAAAFAPAGAGAHVVVADMAAPARPWLPRPANSAPVAIPVVSAHAPTSPSGYESPEDETAFFGRGPAILAPPPRRDPRRFRLEDGVDGGGGDADESPASSSSTSLAPDLENGTRIPRTGGPRRPQMQPRTLSTASSLNGMVSKARNMGRRHGRKVGIRDRIDCFQWTWFTMTMATGGIANCLYSIPFRSQWLTIVGLVFFFLNIVLFIINCIVISLRFHWRPGSFVHSFKDQFESLFIPSFVVSIATILITVCQYGIPNTGPWLLQAMEIMFWTYVFVAAFASAGMYLTLWSTQVFPIHTMTPVWVFPAYPLLMTAPFGGNLISVASGMGQLTAVNSVAITLAAVTVQGTGFLIAFMIMAAFLYRLMTQKLPRDYQRPGMFISIGPGGFTAASMVQLGTHTAGVFPGDFLGNRHSIFILELLAYMTGLWLWGLSIWFFLVAVGSLWKYAWPEHRSKMPFQMTWFSFVFPNTALVTATEHLGRAFGIRGLEVFGAVMAGLIVLVWVAVFGTMVRCLWEGRLLWPKEED